MLQAWCFSHLRQLTGGGDGSENSPPSETQHPIHLGRLSGCMGEALLNPVLHRTVHDFKHNILAGIITAGPLFITWLVFSFVMGVLAKVGLPFVRLLAVAFPGTIFASMPFQYTLAVLLTIVLFYLVGKITSEVVGRQMFELFETALERLPVVNKIYTSVRQAIDTLMNKKNSGQRVVLIDFPSAGQKSIGFLTHVLSDATTGMPIAAVLVPQAINPSSSYLQFVPLSAVIETDLTMEQAMSMLLTGGAVCPEVIHYSSSAPAAVNRDGTPIPVTLAIETSSITISKQD
jgi:uncharacterized membrane protein